MPHSPYMLAKSSLVFTLSPVGSLYTTELSFTTLNEIPFPTPWISPSYCVDNFSIAFIWVQEDNPRGLMTSSISLENRWVSSSETRRGVHHFEGSTDPQDRAGG